jgi:drug/metabolite transporter (DMT)-like permease
MAADEMRGSATRRGAAEMTVAMLMSGTIGWLVVSSQQSAFNVVFFRCVFGGATLALVCAALGLFRRNLFSWRMLGLAMFGGVAIVINWVLLFAAYSRASISMATAVYNTQPFMLVALGAVVFRERITASTIAWLLVAFGGLVLVVRVEPAVLAMPGRYLEGIAYAVGAAAMYAVSSIITKHLKGTPPHLIALIQVGLGVLMLAPFVRFDALPTTGAHWLELMTLGIVNTGIMYAVVAIIVDRVAFGQKLAWVQVFGAVLILLAAAGVNLGWRLVPQRRYSPT